MVGKITTPYELLELKDGESATFKVLDWAKGRAKIFPDHAPQGKDVDIIRIAVPPTDKATFPYYWDVTQATLVAQVEPHLLRPDLDRIRFTVTAQGFGAKKRFRLEVAPA